VREAGPALTPLVTDRARTDLMEDAPAQHPAVGSDSVSAGQSNMDPRSRRCQSCRELGFSPVVRLECDQDCDQTGTAACGQPDRFPCSSGVGGGI
jgi:hypothetical protein